MFYGALSLHLPLHLQLASELKMLPTLRMLIALLFHLLIVSQDVETNPGPKIESEPKITELECFGKKDGSGSIHIINKIATEFPHWKCEEFSHKLLNDQTFKMSAFKEKVAFVYELFRRWLRQPTSELSGATRRPLPRTWEVLAKCLERFDRLLAKEIRENCDKVKMSPKTKIRFAIKPRYNPITKEKKTFKHATQDSFKYSRKRILSPVCGLQNLGNQCYMNATLQCLSHTHMLRDCLWKPKPNSVLPSLLQSHHGLGEQIVTAYTEFQEKIWQEQRKVVSPISLKQTVGHFAPRFAGHAQEDAQEFLTFLLDGLHEGMNRVKEKKYVSMTIENGESWTDKEMADELWRRHLIRNDSKIVELFHGQIKSVLKCLKCTKVAKTFEPVIQLTLPIPANSHFSGKEMSPSKTGPVTVYDCLNLYVKEKPLTWACEHCRSTDCVQKYDIWKLPPILIIHLKRFTVTGSDCHKVYTNVGYPNNFDLSEYNVAHQHLDNTQYELYAVINHSGMLYAGHYTAYVREGDTWFLCDDEHVSEVSNSQTPNAYVLFYKQSTQC